MPRLQGCFEMPWQEATRPRNIIRGFPPSYMARPITAATTKINRLEYAAVCCRATCGQTIEVGGLSSSVQS
jgi:hypothetical protein